MRIESPSWLRLEPGVLGLTPSNCWLLHLLRWIYLYRTRMTKYWCEYKTVCLYNMHMHLYILLWKTILIKCRNIALPNYARAYEPLCQKKCQISVAILCWITLQTCPIWILSYSVVVLRGGVWPTTSTCRHETRLCSHKSNTWPCAMFTSRLASYCM